MILLWCKLPYAAAAGKNDDKGFIAAYLKIIDWKGNEQ